MQYSKIENCALICLCSMSRQSQYFECKYCYKLNFHRKFGETKNQVLNDAPINVKPARGVGGGAQGGLLIDRFGPLVGHLNFLAVLGIGISEFLFVPVTTNHFLGWEIQLQTDRQTDMFLFGVLYKESTLTTISK